MPPDPEEGGGGSAVDESLYSRQLYVMGHEAQVQYGGGTACVFVLRILLGLDTIILIMYIRLLLC